MYSRRYKNCCCQSKYDNKVIETMCNNVGTTAEYYHPSANQCDCGFEEDPAIFPANPMLAQSYVPIQYMDKTFTPTCGLKMGTIFPELVSPYVPCQSMEEIAYLKASNSIGEGCNKC